MNQQRLGESKPKLIPVKVPWQISLAVPAVKLTLYASARIVVEFAAIILHEIKGLDQLADDKIFDQNEELITVTFLSAFWLRAHPTVDEGEIDYEKYDASALEPLHVASKDISPEMKAYERRWLSTGICPDPGMYEVEGSDWIPSELALKDGYKHYLLIGQELYYEIYGKDWEWTSKGVTSTP